MATIRRVTTVIAGPYVQGGGIATHYFDTLGTPAQVITAVRGFWFAMCAFVGTGTTFTVQGLIANLDESTGQLSGSETATGGTETGTGGTDVLPMHVQGVAQFRTGVVLDGREIRGRTFIPAPIETANTAAIPTAAYVAQLNTAADQIINDVNTGFGVWRRPRVARPQVGSPGDRWFLRAQAARSGTFEVASAGDGSTKWGTLRSRRD